MINLWFDILLLATICVIVTDISGFFDHFQEWLGKKLKAKVQLKILECPNCQAWWCSLLYLVITHQVHLYSIAYALFIAFIMQKVIEEVLFSIQGTLMFLLDKMNITKYMKNG